MRASYSNERHIQILIYLLKAHNIRKVVASPGTTNLTFIGSIQSDDYFEIYSSVDEISAAYIACGLAAESGESVVLSCTGATASRNYASGLTEAYYRKLPVLAVTSSQYSGRIEQNFPQVIDRRVQFNDISKMSKHIGIIHSEEDAWNCVVSINDALLELRHRGCGPVHLNVETTYSKDFSIKELPAIRVIRRICYKDHFPELVPGRIGIFVGAHLKWTNELTIAVDEFCSKYDAVVFCDQTSNYYGKYAIYPSLVCSQDIYVSPCRDVKCLIHMGDVSAADIFMNTENVWRINPDGVVRDTFKKLKYVFEMEEIDFFNKYNQMIDKMTENIFYHQWVEECEQIWKQMPELPFSNVWIASQTLNKFPAGSIIYYGILNTFRSWSYFKASKGCIGYSNTGGFGIDGGVSTLIGASFVHPDKLYFCMVGDLGFFYDMNVLGNRHVSNNIRIMVVNNGRGAEFTNYNHLGARFGEAAKPFIAAAGHFGNQSRDLLCHYAEDLGYEYLSASNKDEYLSSLDKFVAVNIGKKPIVFEVFTDSEMESDAVKIMRNIKVDFTEKRKRAVKTEVKNIIGEKGVSVIKAIMGR